MFTIDYMPRAVEDLDQIQPYHRNRVIHAIELQLTHQPCHETKNRKIVRGLKAPWSDEGEFWELRVEGWRVFYDVDIASQVVTIQTIRRKPPHQTTEQVL